MLGKHKIPDEFWHVRHACGHSVYWSDPDVGMRTSFAPCPWCGAERGPKVPADVAMLRDPKTGWFAFRELLPGKLVPWPADLANVPETVTVRHMTGDVCCDR